jgi:hypothetical protein
MERQLVRTHSGRLLWLTGISLPDPASERLAASLLSVASLLSLASLVALIIQLTSGWYFGASLFGSLFLPLLAWAVRVHLRRPFAARSRAQRAPHPVPLSHPAAPPASPLSQGVRCRSRCLLICSTLANAAMLFIFLATTLPFLITVAPALPTWAGWLYVFAAFSLLTAALHVAGFVLGCQASCNPAFQQPLRKEVLTAVTAEDYLYFGGGGAPAVKSVWVRPQEQAQAQEQALQPQQQATAGRLPGAPPALSAVV